MMRIWIGMMGVATLAVACAPPIYVLDRPTAIELESGGQFPELEEEFLQKGEAIGPRMEPKSDAERKAYERRNYRVLEGNPTSDQAQSKGSGLR